MRFVSTRGGAPEIGFRAAVLSAAAPDGGLYTPMSWPSISEPQRAAFSTLSFAAAMARILAKFAEPELRLAALERIAGSAYAEFGAPDVAPLRRVDQDTFILELFHGPTLSFKDVALQMLAALYHWALEGRVRTIIGATSGDTGAAAIQAFSRTPGVEIFMLHPKGRISEVQRRMMTTTGARNVVNLAVEGTFDDCQKIVKSLFADAALAAALDLGAVNSINVVRLLAQATYYFTAAAALDRRPCFIVPTGNFGDAFAGFAAAKMGLPMERIAVAVNANDTLRRALTDGAYAPRPAAPTTSPAMDIQRASNFERILFEASRRDPHPVCAWMDRLETVGRIDLAPELRADLGTWFLTEKAEEDEVAAAIRAHHRRTGELIDPHTAVGVVGLEKLRAKGVIEGPAVCLATAHPAKFPDVVESACGVRPALPARYRDLFDREERLISAPAQAEAIRDIILRTSAFIARSR
jgi:threonine synthase